MTPDFIAAVIVHLKNDPGVTALTTEIVPRSVKTPQLLQHAKRNLIVVETAPGFGVFRLPTLFMRPHFQVRCYGSTGFNAMQLWRAVDHALIPPEGPWGFIENDCQIDNIALVNSPITLIEDDWETRLAVYSAYMRRVPVT